MDDQPNPAAPATLRALDRQELALGLRKQGASYRKIASQLRQREDVSDRYTVATAYKDVMTALTARNSRLAELADEVRRLELERLDDLHVVYWARAIKGDYAALNLVLGLMDRRARYLDLYQEKKPALVDITVFIRQAALEYGLDPDQAVAEAVRITQGKLG